MLISIKTRSDIGEENREKVFDYFARNPDSLLKDAQQDLGLSAPSIRGHIRAINDGWRPSRGDQG